MVLRNTIRVPSGDQRGSIAALANALVMLVFGEEDSTEGDHRPAGRPLRKGVQVDTARERGFPGAVGVDDPDLVVSRVGKPAAVQRPGGRDRDARGGEGGLFLSEAGHHVDVALAGPRDAGDREHGEHRVGRDSLRGGPDPGEADTAGRVTESTDPDGRCQLRVEVAGRRRHRSQRRQEEEVRVSSGQAADVCFDRRNGGCAAPPRRVSS